METAPVQDRGRWRYFGVHAIFTEAAVPITVPSAHVSGQVLTHVVQSEDKQHIVANPLRLPPFALSGIHVDKEHAATPDRETD